jgi:phosphate transport system protein
MLRNAVRAADESDLGLAREVVQRDQELDAEFATALRQLMSFVMQDHHFLKASIDTVFALKGLERIGDHATNIAEQVLYMVEGQDTPA